MYFTLRYILNMNTIYEFIVVYLFIKFNVYLLMTYEVIFEIINLRVVLITK